MVSAVTELTKYGGIVVLPAFDAAALSALMTLRLNIFTDPQKPIQVEPGIYPIGEPGADSRCSSPPTSRHLFRGVGRDREQRHQRMAGGT